MKIGIQINKEYKCPHCKRFSLRLMNRMINYYNEDNYTVNDREGIGSSGYNFFCCRNCYAEYKVIKDLK